MNPMSKHKQSGKISRGGFTLVEVVIATALLIMALALFLSSFVQSKRSVVMANNRIMAIQNARTVLEGLLPYTYGATQLNNGWHSTSVSGVSYVVATVTQTPSIVVKNIYVTNRWINPGSGITSTVSLAGSVSSELHP